jgi:bacterial/archaeal transporter family protein
MKPWLIYALMTLAAWGFWGVFSKFASNHGRPRQILLFQAVGAIAFAAVVLTFERFHVDWSPAAFGWSFAAGFVNFMGFLTFFAAVEKGKVSTIITLSSLYPVVTIIFSMILLHERISRREGLGIVMALAAGWLLAG